MIGGAEHCGTKVSAIGIVFHEWPFHYLSMYPIYYCNT